MGWEQKNINEKIMNMLTLSQKVLTTQMGDWTMTLMAKLRNRDQSNQDVYKQVFFLINLLSISRAETKKLENTGSESKSQDILPKGWKGPKQNNLDILEHNKEKEGDLKNQCKTCRCKTHLHTTWFTRQNIQRDS